LNAAPSLNEGAGSATMKAFELLEILEFAPRQLRPDLLMNC